MAVSFLFVFVWYESAGRDAMSAGAPTRSLAFAPSPPPPIRRCVPCLVAGGGGPSTESVVAGYAVAASVFNVGWAAVQVCGRRAHCRGGGGEELELCGPLHASRRFRTWR